MDVTQVHSLVNTATQEVLGESGIVNEDLSNVVDVGNAVLDSNKLDNYVNKLVDQIGKVVFANRTYQGSVPQVMMDAWEFGSIKEKISADLPAASENSDWSLTDGTDYSPDIFYQPSVTAKFYNSQVTFEIPLSFTEKQVKESFGGPTQLNSFISMLTIAVENSMTVKMDSLIMRTISHMAAETLQDDLYVSGGIDLTQTGVKAVNLLKRYNDETGSSLAEADALTDPDFIRYATYLMGVYGSRMSRISTLFNIEGKERFTPSTDRITVLLADFAKASEAYVSADAQNQERVALPDHAQVPYWQGSGTNYDYGDITAIDVKTSSGDTVAVDGILGVMFDREALGVSNLERRVTSNYNPKAEFYTNFYKFEAGYFNDLSENFVVFFIG